MNKRLQGLNNHFNVVATDITTDIADVVIIGAGIAGLSTSVNLKKRGVEKIVVIDSCEKVGSLMKASTINCGIVCAPAIYSPDPLHMEMLRLT